MSKSKIINSLYSDYSDYYDTVYISFLEEAVENTLEDFKEMGKEKYSIEDVHKHIIENYI